MGYSALIDFVLGYRRDNPKASKQEVAAAAGSELGLKGHRSVYAGNGFAVRFSESSKAGFSGTVCSLRVIQQFDSVPLIVALIRPQSTEFLLANATFVNKVSHSSQQLTVNNVRGSINGSNIIRNYSEIDNCPENFALLFSIH